MTAAPPVYVTHQGKKHRLGCRARSPHFGGLHMMAARQKLAALPDPQPCDRLAAAEAQTPTGDLGEMGNDEVGDCTAAAKGHIIQCLSAYRGKIVTPSDAQILAFYEMTGGYVPGRPDTDNGAVMLDTEIAWQNGVASIPQIDSFVPLDPLNIRNICVAIEQYGFADVGLSLPQTIDGQDGPWFVDLLAGAAARKGSLGGHDVTLEAWGPGWFDFVTWGRRKRMSWNFWEAYGEEAYTGPHPLWFDAQGKSPLGRTLQELRIDLSSLGAVA